MFSGIIQHIGVIKKTTPSSLYIDFPKERLVEGASVSVDGVCLTAVEITDGAVLFELSEETLRLTTLKNVQVGDFVNIERALKYGDEIGGHLVSGHVFETVELCSIKKNVYIFSRPAKNFLRHKGFVALNGVSLTVCDPTELGFCIHFIPETLRRTTFLHKKEGDLINLEYDLNHALCKPT